MDILQISYKELAARMNVSEQTTRYWTSGRSNPTKEKLQTLERVLTFKADYTEGVSDVGATVSESMDQADIELFLKLRKLPVSMRLLFEKLVDAYVETDGALDLPPVPFSSESKKKPQSKR